MRPRADQGLAKWQPVDLANRSFGQSVAVTPIQLDLTARRLLKRLRSWSWDLPSKPPRAADARHNKG